MRTENAICQVCKKAYYRRPYQRENFANNFCSLECYGKSKRRAFSLCETCHKPFHGKRREQRFCCGVCALKQRSSRTAQGMYSGSLTKNKSKMMFEELRRRLDFKTCMIEGCSYDKTFDIHRLIPGSDGGKYEVGNMFAICPNHHAEIHRNIIKVEKVNDGCLREKNL
jgi:hypothetical protein